MSERYKPSRLRSARNAQIARGESPAVRSSTQSYVGRVDGKLVTLCRHDNNWRACTLCSKPRTIGGGS